MFGRRCRTRMLIMKEKLIPRYNLKYMETLKKNKLIKQKWYYDRTAKDKREISDDEEILMKKPGESTWTQGSCVQMERNRSYEVVVDDKTYLRNRIDIKPVRKNKTVDTNEEKLSEETNEEKENEELTIRTSGRLNRPPGRLINSC